MNFLHVLYGTEKTASEAETTEYTPEQLANMSAADYLAATQGAEETEKLSEADIDNMSEEELLSYKAQLDVYDSFNKLAHDADANAHAALIATHVIEQIKLAGAADVEEDAGEDEYEELDLSNMSAADLVAGIESGEIVMPEPGEKTASEETGELDLTQMSAADFIAGVENGEIEYVGEEKTASKVEAAKAALKAVAKGTQARRGAEGVKQLWKLRGTAHGKEMLPHAVKDLAAGGAKTVGLYGAGATGVVGTGALGVKAYRKVKGKKKSKK